MLLWSVTEYNKSSGTSAVFEEGDEELVRPLNVLNNCLKKRNNEFYHFWTTGCQWNFFSHQTRLCLLMWRIWRLFLIFCNVKHNPGAVTQSKSFYDSHFKLCFEENSKFFPVEKSFEMIIRYHHVMEMDSLLFNTIQQQIYVADGNNTFWNRYTYSQNRFRKVKIENNI